MNRIAIMDMSLANMIAAGEVVERPSSVVKELVENAIDAHATLITIEINNIGLDSIIVTDNGSGMTLDDLKLSFLRHATSKVFKKDDLNHIETLGFRGEALPSIASVAKLTIQSRTENSDGYFIHVENSKLVDEGSIAMNQGTKVIVKELFYNTPARFKYIRSEIAEKNAVIEVFEKLALSHPYIQFKLIIDQKEYKKTLGNGSVKALVEYVYGKNMSLSMKELHTQIGKIKIDAYLLDPKFSKTKRNDVNIFINSRYVKNYTISQAVIEGYNSFLMTNKYPITLVYLSIDPTLVDVNVHPQKMEVKLANELMLAYALTPQIKEALEEGALPIRETIKEVKKEIFKVEKQDIFTFEEVKVTPKEEVTYIEKKDLTNESIDFTEELLIEEVKEEVEVVRTNEPKIPSFDYIGTFRGTYLLFQNETGLFMIDQHAAAERIRYEYYIDKVGELKADYYELLVPHQLFLSLKDVELVNHFEDLLKNIGFIIKNDKLYAHPTWLHESEIEKAVESIIEQLNDYQDVDLKKLRNQLAKDISCKGAIMANHQLSMQEIDKLIDNLRKCNNPYTCPHGRPVLIKLSNYDVEKMFKRIV
ncbi:DNA mismatch repair endonuclease MutL, partial [Acholeplasma hippikon]